MAKKKNEGVISKAAHAISDVLHGTHSDDQPAEEQAPQEQAPVETIEAKKVHPKFQKFKN